MSIDKEKLLRDLYKEKLTGTEWLDKVPNEISPAIFDNPYCEYLAKSMDMSIDAAFGRSADTVQWILNDWFWDKDLRLVSPNGTEMKIDSIDDYIDYVNTYEGGFYSDESTQTTSPLNDEIILKHGKVLPVFDGNVVRFIATKGDLKMIFEILIPIDQYQGYELIEKFKTLFSN